MAERETRHSESLNLARPHLQPLRDFFTGQYRVVVERYARRMIIENRIQDGIDFFHMDALSSAVPMKVDCDLQLTLMGSSLYRMLGAAIGGTYTTAESRHLFRDFVARLRG